MVDYSIGQRIHEAVKACVSRNSSFSAGSIIASIAPKVSPPPSLNDVSDYIETLFMSGEMKGYERSQQHGADSSVIFSGYLYYPSEETTIPSYEAPSTPLTVIKAPSEPEAPAVKPVKIEKTNAHIHERANIKETSEGLRMPRPLPTPIELELKEADVKQTYPAQSIIDALIASFPSNTQRPATPLDVEPAPVPPIKKRPYDPKSEMVYFVDGHNRVCLPQSQLDKIGLKPGDSVFILSERKRVTIVKENPIIGCRKGGVDDDGILRILASSVGEAGLGTTCIFTVEHDKEALYLRPVGQSTGL